ncbi:glycoside hydrolase [Mycena belliarum]|uniref:Trehalase n=1 Tax=Mycena belliarum TaxID=1033014 RepID=A0AAD6TWY5_9AGAR|nr:glycoside hydrolase [Mycena belliae]
MPTTTTVKILLPLAALVCVNGATTGGRAQVAYSISAPALAEHPTLPPPQSWCLSTIFCAGPLLQTLSLARIVSDPKTLVDKPTSKPLHAVLADFALLPSHTTISSDLAAKFLAVEFSSEGRELAPLPLPGSVAVPSFLRGVANPLVRAFAGAVHGFWSQLVRGTNASALCTDAACESSFIPLNHPFVIPGGRFREQYYWDSFWVLEGLLASELFGLANATLQNFMDEIERFGFIPNGGRIYYLNRSQPPLFIHMLARYVSSTNDTAVLMRALPLAERELTWWSTNRTISVRSPFTGRTHEMARYDVTNSAPRPESYLQDYETAHDPSLPALNASARAALYAELASGAETGWDFSSRWLRQDFEVSSLRNTSVSPRTRMGDRGMRSMNSALRALNVRGIVPVDLNSILYKNRVLMAGLYAADKPNANASEVARHTTAAEAIKEGVLDLCWDAAKLAFYDFDLTTSTRSPLFTAAAFYPFWAGIIPREILASAENAFGAFAALNMVLNRYNGTLPATFVESGMQWDAPNAWPPSQYIALQALRTLPENVTRGALPVPAAEEGTFSLVPAGQLGLEESALPLQALRVGLGSPTAPTSGAGADVSRRADGTVVNGGNITGSRGGWADALEAQLANRYVASVLCSWHATGGAIAGLLPRLSDAELNLTQSISNTGNMFEKFSITDVNAAGQGGEYTVQAGFGWTNGVLLWIASNYGDVLVAPECPPLLAAASGTPTRGRRVWPS